MNKETMEVRHKQWENIIKQCHSRPLGQTVTQWLAERGISASPSHYVQYSFILQIAEPSDHL